MPTGEGQSTPPTDLDTGEVLNGAWRLEEQIGAGGMGRVFRATDLKLARKAAVKALSVSNLDDETVKRFEREAQVMGRLDHPGVVTLYGVGRTRGVPWLAMKHLEGRSLWGVLDENGGMIPPAVLLPIARQLLVALGYIHGRGLLHRDLKPSNIHVGVQGKVTLLDLGLARGHRSTLTRTGVIWGTPDYMAPEQIVGERQLDGRADLYSLSVVLYRMLSGTSPFPEEDEHELMRAHLMNPRPDISRVVAGCSALLGVALQKGLAIRPEERFQTAEEMLAGLEKAMVAPAREAATTVQPRRSNAENLAALDLTPKSGQRPITNPSLPRAEVRTDPSVAGVEPEGPSGPTMVVSGAEVAAAAGRGGSGVKTVRPPPSAPTDRAVDAVSGPREEPTAPSEPFAQALAEPVTGKAAPRLPVHLTPPFLIGGAVLLIALGVLLGKLL